MRKIERLWEIWNELEIEADERADEIYNLLFSIEGKLSSLSTEVKYYRNKLKEKGLEDEIEHDKFVENCLGLNDKEDNNDNS